MSEMTLYSLLLIINVFLSSVSQILLKKSAGKIYKNKKAEYLNPLVIGAYSVFLCCTFFSIYILKVLPLSYAQGLETVGYIFITILSYTCLKETITKKQILGMITIIIGILIFVQ